MKFLKKFFLWLIILVIVGSGGFFYWQSKNRPGLEDVTETIKAGKLVQTVSETGSVKSPKEIEIHFLTSGRLASIEVKEGQTATSGQILARLDTSSLAIKKTQAQAALAQAQASWQKLKDGPTAAEIAVAQAKANQARANLDAARQELVKTQAQAQESVAQAQKTLADLNDDQINTTYEQAIELAKTSLKTTKQTYQNLIDNKKSAGLITAQDKISVGYVALDAVKTILDNDTDAFLNAFSAKDKTFINLTNNAYKQAQEQYQAAQTSLSQAQADHSQANIEQALSQTINFLDQTAKTLDYCFKALKNSIISFDFTQTDLDAYKTSIQTQITNVNTALSLTQTALDNLQDAILNYQTNVANAQETLDKARIAYEQAKLTAENSLKTAQLSAAKQITSAQGQVDLAAKAFQSAQASLNKLLAPANKNDLAVARHKIEQAQANLASIEKQIADSAVTAPIDGLITKINFEVGEYITPANTVMTMLADHLLEVEVDISEADISKVKLGDWTEITFDAFPAEQKAYGSVYFIDPAQTIIQDVVYYQTKIHFYPPDKLLALKKVSSSTAENYARLLKQIKPGMTANVVITTAQKDKALIAPERAIVEANDGQKMIRLLKQGQLIKQPVKVGLRGDDGLVEILAGAKAGDQAVTFIRENK